MLLASYLDVLHFVHVHKNGAHSYMCTLFRIRFRSPANAHFPLKRIKYERILAMNKSGDVKRV